MDPENGCQLSWATCIWSWASSFIKWTDTHCGLTQALKFCMIFPKRHFASRRLQCIIRWNKKLVFYQLLCQQAQMSLWEATVKTLRRHPQETKTKPLKLNVYLQNNTPKLTAKKQILNILEHPLPSKVNLHPPKYDVPLLKSIHRGQRLELLTWNTHISN